MITVFKTRLKLFVRINQNDLDEALTNWIFSKFPEYEKGYRFSLPCLGPSDVIEAEEIIDAEEEQ
jgi:hypothetical protein